LALKKKILIGLLSIPLVSLFWYFGFFTPRNYSFAWECLQAKKEQEKHFFDNKPAFFELASLVHDKTPITFDLSSNDSLYITFQDSSINYSDLFIDSTYNIRPRTKTVFRINTRNCLEVVNQDTIEVCNHNWQIQFYGHYKDKRIDNLLNYYGWKRLDFERVVEKVQELDCYGFINQNTSFGLSYKLVYYHEPTAGLFGCFGHSNGYFDYLYTTESDSFYWQNSLNQYEGNFHGIEHWSFY
jgi:hypothetical protein